MAVSTFGAAVAKVLQPKQAIITASTTFTVPPNVTTLDVTAVGGGACGYYSGNYYAGGSGAVVKAMLTVTPGEVVPITVGAGGTGGASTGGNGGATIVKNIFAGGGSKEGASGDYSLDLEGGNALNIPVIDYQDLTNRGENFSIGHRIPGTDYMLYSHTSNYTNGERLWQIWDPKTMAAPFQLSRGWTTGTDGGARSSMVVKFKDKLVIFRYNSNPATFGQSSVGCIQYIDLASVTSGGSATCSTAVMPAGITQHSTNLTVAFGSPIAITDDYIYFATRSNGIIRSADGVTWTTVLAYSSSTYSPSNSGYGHIWVDNQNRIGMVIGYTSYAAYVLVTNTAQTSWTVLSTMSTPYLYGISYGGNYQTYMQGAYDPVSDVFRTWWHQTQSSSGQGLSNSVIQWVKIASNGTSYTSGSEGISWSLSQTSSVDFQMYPSAMWDNPKTLVLSFAGHFGVLSMTNGTSGHTTRNFNLIQTSIINAQTLVSGYNSLTKRFHVGRNNTSPSYTTVGFLGSGIRGRTGYATSQLYGAVGGSAGSDWVYNNSAGVYSIVGQGVDGYGQGGHAGSMRGDYYTSVGLPYGNGSFNQSNTYYYGAGGVVILRWWE